MVVEDAGTGNGADGEDGEDTGSSGSSSSDSGNGSSSSSKDTGGDTGNTSKVDDGEAAKIRRAATSKARSQLLESAGVESVDELLALATEARDARSQNETETERLRREAETDRQALQRERAELREQRISFELAEQLRSSTDEAPGIKADRVNDAVEFLARDLVSLDESEDEADAIKAAAAEARTRWPEWFQSGDGDQQSSRTPSTPKRTHGQQSASSGDDPRERARKKFAAMRGGPRSSGDS